MVLDWYCGRQHPKRRRAVVLAALGLLLLLRLVEWESMVALRDGGLGDRPGFHVHMGSKRGCYLLSEGGSPYLPVIQRLDLSDCGLRELPRHFPWGQLHALQELNLANNALERLPEELATIPILQVLHLGGNRLTSFPPPVRKMSKLEVLGLAHNRLTSLGEAPLPSKLTQLCLIGAQPQ